MKKILLLSILTGLLCIGVNAAAGPLYINEVLLDPNGLDSPNEYVEIRGAANSTIPANTYLLEIEGDGSGSGIVQDSLDLSGLIIGSNGFIVIAEATSPHTFNPNATVFMILDSIENSSTTFILAQSPAGNGEGIDIDLDNNGTPDNAFYTQLVINDSFGLLDGSATDVGYGEINYTTTGTGLFLPGSVVIEDTFTDPGYIGRRGDTTGSTAADWVVSNDPTPTPPAFGGVANFFLGNAANVFPDSVAGQQLNHVGGTNANFIVTAAPGTIQGRARFANGRGIKHSVVMLTGGALDEPIYATTNQFGYYQFQDVGVGQSYVMQITSRRYTFQNSSRVINLEDSITNEDFIVDEPSKKTIPNKKDGSLNQKESKSRP